MEHPTAPGGFRDTPLRDFVVALAAYHKIDIRLDHVALKEKGVPETTPVTIDLKGIKVKSALRLVLVDLGLTCAILDDVLLTTTPEAAEGLQKAW